MAEEVQPISPPPLAMETSFKGDEGYSEDARSQDDGDSTMGVEPRQAGASALSLPAALVALQNAVMALDEGQRSEHAYQVLRTLRTSSIAAIVERLTPLLHLDPVLWLPPDVTSIILAYTTPKELLIASRVSKAWRERAMDSLLWKEMFRGEGWVLDMGQVSHFERNYQSTPLKKTLSRKAASHEFQPLQKRRMAEGTFNRPEEGRGMPDRSLRARQSSRDSEPVAETGDTQDEIMRDVNSVTPPQAGPSQTPNTLKRETSSIDTTMTSPSLLRHDSSGSLESPVQDRPIVHRNYSNGPPRVNFHHVYKQKRRLEENWDNGKFKSFQLPHKDHAEEAHSECVYTIQYDGKYLVSGSRDRTLRIWDLDTQRLVRRPLEGHKGSVLCLQFDASPEEDLIVSGSSDTDVILWQFSTGKMLKRINGAHRESVLNLKFDKRFLVTCSKDKMIKIWTRQSLNIGDADYPRRGVPGGGKCPSYIIDASIYPPNADLTQYFSPQQLQPIPAYSLIMKIDAHGAAVNAVHIYKDQLVSASGDRGLRVFDIHSGVCTAVCKGHTKGIACVQYDGKRIVSGSSDNTIRIFDPVSQAEVACLKGHEKLVRTIQAAFGDAPGTEEDLEAEARAADLAYIEGLKTGKIAAPPTPLSRRLLSRVDRGNNSRRSEDQHMAIGAKIPPGGGGTPWSRIISGSYDETIIIWKKTSDGSWVAGQTLKQADALLAAGGPLPVPSDRARPGRSQPTQGPAPTPGPAPMQQSNIYGNHPQIHPSLQTMHLPVANSFAEAQASQSNSQTQNTIGNWSSNQNPPNTVGTWNSQHSQPHTQSETQSQIPSQVDSQSQSQPSSGIQSQVQPMSQGMNESVTAQPSESPSGEASSSTHGAPVASSSQLTQAQSDKMFQDLPQAQSSTQSTTSSSRPDQHPRPNAWGFPTRPFAPPLPDPSSSTSTSTTPRPSQPGGNPLSHAQVAAHIAATAPLPLNPPISQLTSTQVAHIQQQVDQLPQNPQGMPQGQLPLQAPAQGHAANPQYLHQVAGDHPSNARVFKLQFDARRVICCSQDPKIVGWDFANGDDDIIECAPFFGSPR